MLTAKFTGPLLPTGWSFVDNSSGNAAMVFADDFLVLSHPVGVQADSISSLLGVDHSAGVIHALVSGDPFDIAVCYGSDVAGDGSTQVGFVLQGATDASMVRFTPYGTTSRLATYGYSRHGGAGATFHYETEQDAWFYGQPAWWRAKYDGTTYSFHGSGDGHNWVEIASVNAGFDAQSIKLVCAQYGAALGNVVRIRRTVDILAHGSEDVRESVPDYVPVDPYLTNFERLPNWLALEALEDSQALHHDSYVSLQTSPTDGATARMLFAGDAVHNRAGMIALVDVATVHESCFAAFGLGVVDGNPNNVDIYSSSPLSGGIELRTDADNEALVIRVKRPLSIDLFNEPYTFIDGRNVLNGHPTYNATGTWWRIERYDDRFRVKYWPNGTEEPTTWFFDGEDPQAAAGAGPLVPYFAICHNDGFPGWGKIHIHSLGFYGLEEGALLPNLDNVWDGGQWINGTARVTDGAQWTERQLYQWDGTNWVPIESALAQAVYSTPFSRSAEIIYTPTQNDWNGHLESMASDIADISAGLNIHDYGFGISDHAWTSTNESGPNTYDWTELDTRLEKAATAGVPITLTILGSALRHRTGDASSGTWPITGYNTSNPFSYCPPTMNFWDRYAQYVADLVRRYDGVNHPVNIQRVQFWNELKGWWSNTLPFRSSTGRYWYEGQTDLYDLCFAAAKSARPDNDPAGAVRFGGPYPVVSTRGNLQGYTYDDHPTQPGAKISGSAGQRYDQRQLDCISYFLQNAVGYDFITIDTKNHNTWDDGICPDAQRTPRNSHGLKMTEITDWIRSIESAPGFRSGLASVPNPAPIGIAEYYTQDTYPDQQNPPDRISLFQDEKGPNITTMQKVTLLFWSIVDVTNRVDLEYFALWQLMDLPPGSSWPINPWLSDLTLQTQLTNTLRWWKDNITGRADVKKVTFPGEPDLLGIAGNGKTMIINYSGQARTVFDGEERTFPAYSATRYPTP